jgi:multicomponent Na+:H+ antiporter subunit E
VAAQILLNLFIAFVWMFLHQDQSAASFVVGYLLGLLLIGALRRFRLDGFYLKRVWAWIKLLALFLKELVVSSLAVIREVVRPRLAVRPGIVTVRTRLKKDWEITLLGCLISLTPGTLTIDVSSDGSLLYIHAMNIEDADRLEEQIQNTFEKAILEVTRD